MAQDLLKYFRIEGRELLEELGRGALSLEKGGGPDVVGQLLRLAHTLKGASRVVKERGIAEQAHAIEELLAPFRDGRPVQREIVDKLLALVDAIGSRLAALDPAPAPASADATAPADDSLSTVRVEIAEIDRLREGVSEVSVQLTALRRLAQHAGGDREQLQRAMLTAIDQIDGEFVQVRDAANHLRLLPAAGLFPLLERAVRDAAQALDKRVELELAGGDTRLDAHVLTGLREALLHVVRNAVAHGIETATQRAARGKPAVGKIAVQVERRASRVAFTCRDDGAGIDVEAVRSAAVRRGVVTAAEAAMLTPDQVYPLVLRGGVTTAASISHVSGRGIGLDVVREAVAKLKGQVTVSSAPGTGATLEISVPVSLTSLPVLELDVSGTTVAIPLDAVRRTLRILPSEVAQSPEGDSVLYEGRAIPFLPLARALNGRAMARAPRAAWSAVVMEAPGGLAAVGADRLLGTANVVVRPMSDVVQVDRLIAGASLDADGHPQLVLDPEGVLAAAGAAVARGPEMAPSPRAPVLIVDDSLTTRMLEQSILESAGYQVELATSAEEALHKTRSRAYSMFLVDVEMPGMDGFEFVARTQADATLRDTPAVLVTSRNAAEDRRRGEQVGARAYIVKGEFDQGHLLHLIRELVG
jgi:two-component system, chemotaxis family, sensor kinase CheA